MPAIFSWLWLLLAAPIPAQSPVIVSAYRRADGIEFATPREVAWDSLLPADLRPAALAADHSRRERLFRQRGKEFPFTEATFTLPVPPDLARRRYYLLDSTGIIEIRPAGMQGTARIYWTDAGEVRELTAFGQLVAPAPPTGNGGFVLSTAEPVTLVLEPSRLSADDLLAPRGESYPHRGTPFREIVRQYRVRQTSPTPAGWIWVQWLPDTAMVEIGCGFRFSLFELKPEPSTAASTDYACDV
jgi:hypothetical protein